MSRIVIFANGNLNQPDWVKSKLRPTDRFYCADGGARHALALDLTPHVLVGDLDSLSPGQVTRLEAAGVTIHRYPAAKDETDLELTFQLAVAEKPEEILLLGALGGRLDQMLANIFLLTRSEYASVRLTLMDGRQWAALLQPHQSITVPGRPGDTLSLVPLSPTVEQVTLTGVRWPLEQVTLSFGSTWTISNVLTSELATVQIGTGLVLVTHFSQNQKEVFDET